LSAYNQTNKKEDFVCQERVTNSGPTPTCTLITRGQGRARCKRRSPGADACHRSRTRVSPICFAHFCTFLAVAGRLFDRTFIFLRSDVSPTRNLKSDIVRRCPISKKILGDVRSRQKRVPEAHRPQKCNHQHCPISEKKLKILSVF